MLCCTDLFDFSSTIDGKTKEDLQHSFSDNSRRLIQTSDSRTQSVYLGDHVTVDTSDQPHADDDCKQIQLVMLRCMLKLVNTGLPVQYAVRSLNTPMH